MKAVFRDMAYAVANSLGVGRMMRHRHRRDILILMYHGVVDDDAPFERWTHLAASEFAWQMEWLRGQYRILPLQQVLAAMRTGKPLPDNTAVVTFDDGLRSIHSRAFPILRRQRIPATVFLTTAFIGTDQMPTSSRIYMALRSTAHRHLDLHDHGLESFTFDDQAQRDAVADRIRAHAKGIACAAKHALVAALEERLEVDPTRYTEIADEFRMLTWDQVREMQGSGLIEFGAHGAHHEILSQLPTQEMRREIVDSCAEVRQRLGVEQVPFAYPNGRRQDFSPEAKSVLREAAANAALSTIEGLCSTDDDLFELKRIGIGNNVGRNRFAAMCSGLETGSRRRLGRLE